MYPELNLSDTPLERNEFNQLLSDNGFRFHRYNQPLEVWKHYKNGKVISFPTADRIVPSDYILYALNKAGINPDQMALYRGMIWGF